jgi:hypothetical protein
MMLMAAPAHAAGRRSPASDAAKPAEKDQLDQGLRSLRQIQYHLDNVAVGTKRNRYVRGGALLAATFYLGGVYIAQERLNSGATLDIARGVVGATGVLFAVGGLLTAFVPPNAEYGAEEFRNFSKTNKDVTEKIDRGEMLLRRYADAERASRKVVGAGFIAVGIADLIWFFGAQSNFGLNFLPYLAGLYGGLGVMLLTLKTPAETEYEEYLRNKQAPASDGKTSLNWGVLPSPNGLQLGMRLDF